MVVAQQTAEPLVLSDRSRAPADAFTGEGDGVVESLVVPLSMVMGQVLSDHMTQHALAEDDNLVETLLLDGSDEALGEGIQVGRLRRQLDRFHADGTDHGVELLGPLGTGNDGGGRRGQAMMENVE